ncbi:MAG: hypothetical protein AB1411_15305 [Nitrospirota bacterium]
MKPALLVFSLVLLSSAAGCALFVPKESRYLRDAQDRATQEDVERQLGQPHLVAATETGEAVWVYEVRQLEPGSQSSWSAFGSWCDEYVLTFDRQGILRRWTHKSQKHGGETQPESCVTNGFKPAS